MLKYDLKHEDNKKLVDKLKNTPKNVEDDINNYLHGEGSKAITQYIVGFTPVSNRNKEHAKSGDFINIEDGNLELSIKSKAPYHYLVFPNKGIGRHNTVAQEFFEKGTESEKENTFKKIMEILKKVCTK